MRYVFNLVLFGIVTLTVSLLIMAIWLCVQQAYAFVYPTRAKVTGTPSDYGIANWRNITLTTVDDIELQGWLLLPINQKVKNPGVLFVHGIAGNRTFGMAHALYLLEAGYIVLVFDLRNHGNNIDGLTTMGIREIGDVKAAFTFLASQPEVDPAQITVFGHSMGGATAILAMVELPSAKALIVETSYTSLIDVVNDGIRSLNLPPLFFGDFILFVTKTLTNENMYDISPIDAIGKIAPRPILFIHGTNDSTIPFEHTELLYQTAQEPKSIWLVPNAGHSQVFAVAPGEYKQRILEFLQNGDITDDF
jgi:dipeptidyl aminopeptidase/acylaminoacyl peptidase